MSLKVDGGNGKLYTRDHPHEIISPHVMRFDEIRFWIKELSTNPAYGWKPGGGLALERSLGMTAHSTKRILTTGWIWPKTQVRLTARIREILDGYIVPTRFAGNRVDGVYKDPPEPRVIPEQPRTLKIQAGINGLRFLAQDHRPPPRLPSFKRAFSEAIEWNPDKK